MHCSTTLAAQFSRLLIPHLSFGFTKACQEILIRDKSKTKFQPWNVAEEMKFIIIIIFIVVSTCYAFTTTLGVRTPSMASRMESNHSNYARQPFQVLRLSSNIPTEEENEGKISSSLPPTPQPTSLDPLIASLTKENPASANQPTQNIPIFGEIPVDGSLLLLVPAAIFAVLGFGMSLVIAFKSQDQIVSAMTQVTESVAQTAANRSNQIYDENVCRGICSSKPDDIEGIKSFMESITRSTR